MEGSHRKIIEDLGQLGFSLCYFSEFGKSVSFFGGLLEFRCFVTIYPLGWRTVLDTT